MIGQQTPQTTVILPEERLRIETAERLTAMMVCSLCLLDDCGKHTAMGKTDAVGALNAAARLIKANADITYALVRAAQGETRHRRDEKRHSAGAEPKFFGVPLQFERRCPGGIFAPDRASGGSQEG